MPHCNRAISTIDCVRSLQNSKSQDLERKARDVNDRAEGDQACFYLTLRLR
jgi:hypothetical protein